MVFVKCDTCGQVWDDTKPLKVVLYGVCPGPQEKCGPAAHRGPFSPIWRRDIQYPPVGKSLELCLVYNQTSDRNRIPKKRRFPY